MPFDRIANHGLAVSAGLALVMAAGVASAQTPVLTYHNDLARTGLYATETLLTPANVGSARFGKRFSHAVDGAVYAQPLYVPRVTIPGKGIHNVVYVATERDVVYAFDADTDAPPNDVPLWSTILIPSASGESPVSYLDLASCGDLVPDVGITSTPVIDPATGTLYVLARTEKPNGQGGNFFYQRLYALSTSTGLQKRPPAEIDYSILIPGATGDGSVPTEGLHFDTRYSNQRSGLVLSKGVVYAAWASHCDINPYHGWVMGFNASTLDRVFTYTPTANGRQAGIWQAGAAMAVDAAGNLFFETGNGTFVPNENPRTNFGDSLIKLRTAGSPAVLDYFTPANQDVLDAADLDFGSGGAMILPDQPGPHRHLVLACGKAGTVFVVDRDNMGGKLFDGSSNHVVQEVDLQAGTWTTPAYWNGRVFYQGTDDSTNGNLVAFSLKNGLLSTSPISQSPDTFGYPGATPAISAHGTQNGIVWTLETSNWEGAGGPAELRAYDALDLSHQLFRSNDRASDVAPFAVKFVVPTIANGRVYVAGRGELAVYGLTAAQFSQPNYSVTEGGKALITVKRLAPANGTLVVNYSTSDGTAKAGVNYTAIPPGTLTFGPGVTTKTFSVATLQDTFNEPGRTVLLGITYLIDGVTLGDTAVLTIKDNDVAGQVAFSAAAYAAKQTAGSATITVRRTGGTAAGVTVHYATIAGGTATAPTDYTATNGDLNFAAGQTLLTFPVPLPFTPTGAADDRTVNLALTSPGGGATPGAPSSAVLTIAGSGATFAFSSPAYSASEAATGATITVVRHGSSAGAVSVVASTTSGGSAQVGVDYQDVNPTLTFKPGVTLQTFKVPLLKDPTVEGAETVNLSLGSPISGGLGVQRTATLNLTAISPTVRFSAAAYKVSQALAKTNVVVTRAGSLVGTVTVPYSATDGTAISGTDYLVAPATLTFGPGVTSRSFPVSILPDSVHDGDETVNLLLGTPSANAYLGTPATAVLTITDTAPSRVQLAVADSSVGEGGGHAMITVTRTGNTTTTVTVDYATVDLSPAPDAAQAGVNYTATAGTLSLAPGETSATFGVPVLNGAPTSSTRVGVALSNPTGGAALGSLTAGTLWIVDGQ